RRADRRVLDRLGDLVALEAVLERADPEAELPGEPAQHQDLVLAVAVAVHEALAEQDLTERVELEIAAQRRATVPRARGDVLARGDEAVADQRLDPHAAVRIAVVAGAARALHVL